MPLRLDSRPVGEVLVIQCSGRIVAGAEVQSLQLQLRKVLPEHHDVVLQLENVPFIDSSGIGALVRLAQSARANGGELKLCGLQPAIRKTLELTNLLSLFKVYDSEADAIVAAYLGPRHSQDEGDGQLRILCVYDSADMRAFLGEVLCGAGYRALTAGNLQDAQILLRATKARLIILGANMQTVYGASARKAFEEIDPTVTVIVLDQDFAAGEPGEVATKLLQTVRSSAPGKTA